MEKAEQMTAKYLWSEKLLGLTIVSALLMASLVEKNRYPLLTKISLKKSSVNSQPK